jgi:hypothetical protein
MRYWLSPVRYAAKLAWPTGKLDVAQRYLNATSDLPRNYYFQSFLLYHLKYYLRSQLSRNRQEFGIEQLETFIKDFLGRYDVDSKPQRSKHLAEHLEDILELSISAK